MMAKRTEKLEEMLRLKEELITLIERIQESGGRIVDFYSEYSLEVSGGDIVIYNAKDDDNTALGISMFL